MPKKPNGAGGMQEYIPAGNGDASGEYGNSKGENKHFSSFKKGSSAKSETKGNSTPKSQNKPKNYKKGTIANYKGYGIDYDIYGNGEFSVQYGGDDILFDSEEEARTFIDSKYGKPIDISTSNGKTMPNITEYLGIGNSSTESSIKSSKTDGDFGYHAGDLGKGETRERQRGGRDTGHFGTGTYFVGDESKIATYNDGNYGKGKAPHHTVDFSSYNLYRPSSNSFGYRLHNTLRIINNNYKMFYKYGSDYDYLIKKGLAKDNSDFKGKDIPEIVSHLNNLLYDKIELPSNINWETIESEISDVEDKLWDKYDKIYPNDFSKKLDGINTELYSNKKYKAFRDVCKEIISTLKSELDWHTLDRFDDYKNIVDKLKAALEYRHSEGKIRSALEEVNKHLDDEQGDSLSTIFMKALGYEGVDVRHLNKDAEGLSGLDNTAYGSVIYDVRPETIVKTTTRKRTS